MHILISGGTGFVGTALCASLTPEHELVVITRSPRPASAGMRFITGVSEIDANAAFDVVINLAGEPIADKRWTAAQRATIVDSRLRITEELVAYFETTDNKPKVFISGSAIGYYGIGASAAAITEDDTGDNSFSSRLCTAWETSALAAQALGIRTCVLRTGIVLGNNGGALKKMLPAFRWGLGGNIGDGNQWMSWIHLADLIGIINYCIATEQLQGPVNGTAPCPVTNHSFTATLGRVLRRPTRITMPAFVIRALMGDMGTELLLCGKKVLPAKVQQAGYQFHYPALESALSDLLA